MSLSKSSCHTTYCTTQGHMFKSWCQNELILKNFSSKGLMHMFHILGGGWHQELNSRQTYRYTVNERFGIKSTPLGGERKKGLVGI